MLKQDNSYIYMYQLRLSGNGQPRPQAIFLILKERLTHIIVVYQLLQIMHLCITTYNTQASPLSCMWLCTSALLPSTAPLTIIMYIPVRYSNGGTYDEWAGVEQARGDGLQC